VPVPRGNLLPGLARRLTNSQAETVGSVMSGDDVYVAQICQARHRCLCAIGEFRRSLHLAVSGTAIAGVDVSAVSGKRSALTNFRRPRLKT
jgi:hypothetical protein